MGGEGFQPADGGVHALFPGWVEGIAQTGGQPQGQEQFALLGQAGQRLGQGLAVVGGHQQSGLFREDHFANRAGVKGNDRQAEALCLEKGDAESFKGGHGEQMVGGVAIDQLAVADSAQKVHLSGEAELCHLSFDFFRIGIAVLFAAYDRELPGSGDCGKGLQQVVQSFARDQVADEEDAERARVAGAGGQGGGVEGSGVGEVIGGGPGDLAGDRSGQQVVDVGCGRVAVSQTGVERFQVGSFDGAVEGEQGLWVFFGAAQVVDDAGDRGWVAAAQLAVDPAE